jgi:hypothetical protein
MYMFCKVFRDHATTWPFRDVLFEDKADIRDSYIHFDGQAVGFGCCCLQVTFQAESFIESLRLYDQLLPLTGIMVIMLFSILLKMLIYILVSVECCMSNLARLSF